MRPCFYTALPNNYLEIERRRSGFLGAGSDVSPWRISCVFLNKASSSISRALSGFPKQASRGRAVANPRIARALLLSNFLGLGVGGFLGILFCIVPLKTTAVGIVAFGCTSSKTRLLHSVDTMRLCHVNGHHVIKSGNYNFLFIFL